MSPTIVLFFICVFRSFDPADQAIMDRVAVDIIQLIHFNSQKNALIVSEESFLKDELLMDTLTRISFPFTLYDSRALLSLTLHHQNAVIFVNSTSPVTKLYHHVRRNTSIKNVLIILIDEADESQILNGIHNERVTLAINRGHYLDIFFKNIDNGIQRFSSVKEMAKNLNKYPKTIGRHLTVATLNYPPFIIVETAINESSKPKIRGIEPALLQLLSETLQFTYSYIFTSPTEMWGDVIINGTSSTCTGLLGFIQRNEVEIASGDLYVDYVRLPCSEFSIPFKMSYECFLVPASMPYPKWTALYHPLALLVWTATLLSFVLSVSTLRFVAKFSTLDTFFKDTGHCFLFTLGNFLGVQQPQEIRATANRLFLISWLIAATIIPTGYRSGLISYMTFPFTPAPINTIEQLAGSSINKIIYGELVLEKLKISPSALYQKLATQIVVNNDLDYMYSLMGTGKWAIDSSQDNLRYVAATRFPPTRDGPKVHLMQECLLPLWTAFGLGKNSQIKELIDEKLMLFVEFGFVDYHRSQYAKKLKEWNPKSNRNLFAFNLNSLQGAFYIYALGITAALSCFCIEQIYRTCHFK